jgi:F0F1-type ATP synthase membrane subunit c/vacuolar-type H+-ATPase subunit K
LVSASATSSQRWSAASPATPASRPHVFGLGMLGFALTEAIALFALLIAFLILFV